MHFTMSYCATVHHDPAVAPGPFLLSRAGQEPLIGYCPVACSQKDIVLPIPWYKDMPPPVLAPEPVKLEQARSRFFLATKEAAAAQNGKTLNECHAL
ncbi:hypothetical protein LMH87_011924 [Akanthomyces muscarius]|uniref:Uncharacterized protein n=1 Tax=Akanthomyces muscarius TaxID=2231603 RepID=A0A9W8QAP3_AKAMU|nr:hypothetical protein LMH87_011924 [Akanthomyces muscarius]KAJ4151210.1 hypothetical protein LMH87_011924 [Akanthomyces muscarius]